MESVAKFDEEMAGTWFGGKALKGLLKFIDAHRCRGGQHEEGCEGFEREVGKRFCEAEREFIGEELERLDVTLPEVVINYARLRAQNLPIGSGIIEATCKTLVTQRMKRSGQRWTNDGSQAVLTFRALAQSDRFDAAGKLISAGRPIGPRADDHGCRLRDTSVQGRQRENIAFSHELRA